MLDKIEFSCRFSDRFLTMVEYYHSKKSIQRVYMSGKFGYLKSFRSSLIQIFYERSNDTDKISAFISVGSAFSNKYGLSIIKLFSRLSVSDIKFTRFDVTHDLVGDVAKNFIIQPLRYKKKPPRSLPQQIHYENKINSDYYDTVYLRTSDWQIRVYDKGVEQQTELFNSDWKRFEIQLNKDRLKKFMAHREYAGESVDVLYSDIRSVVSRIADDYDFRGEYAEIMLILSQGISKAQRIEKVNSAEQYLDNLQKQYFKTALALYCLRPERFSCFSDDTIRNQYLNDYMRAKGF